MQFLKLGMAALACASLGTAVAAQVEASPVEAAPQAHAAPATAAETRTVDARILRVRLDGLVDLRLKQGAVPTLVISGDKTLLAKLTTEQKGDTLIIGTEARGFKFSRRTNGVRAELTLPGLREVTSDRLGWTEVSGFSGDTLDLKLDGAGSMKVNCSYRNISAVLGGVGSMHITGDNVDLLDLNLSGAGVVTLKGTARSLRANLGGLGSLNAEHFHTDTVILDLSGLGNAAVSARQNANLNLSGMGSVAVHGRPVGRSVSVNGLGKVTWK